MRLAIVGTGHVGLVSGAGFSDFGHEVTCVDTDASRISSLNQGHMPIYEPRLETVVRRCMDAGRLRFTADLREAIDQAEVIFISVGTPHRHDEDEADLSQVRDAARRIGSILQEHAVIAIKSTVPVGTCRQVAGIIRKEAPGVDFDVASNPEFLREGAAINDFMHPDRVVIGVDTERAARTMREIYRPLYLREYPIILCSLESAELTKYASNAFLATKISFINEIAALCEKTGADVKAVAHGMGLDNRIGNKFLHAGAGFGGSCFPKDARTLVRMGGRHGTPQTITEAAAQANETAKRRMIEIIVDLCGGSVDGMRIAVLGASFKPNTDDMREAPSLTIVPHLAASGAEVRIVDPKARETGQALLACANWHDGPYEACEGADAVVFLTEWNEFRALDLQRIALSMATPRMADLRNIYDPDSARRAGFQRYSGVGRQS